MFQQGKDVSKASSVKSLEIMQYLIKTAETRSGNPNIVIFVLKTDHAIDDL